MTTAEAARGRALFVASTHVQTCRAMFPGLGAEEAVKAAHAEADLHEFVRQAWPHVESEEFVDGEHIRQLCIHLQAFSKGEIDHFACNIPPQHSKSSHFSVFFPSWEWAQLAREHGSCIGARERYLTFSYRADLALRDNWRARKLMQSKWYQARWGRRWNFSSDQNVKGRYTNDKGGQRVAAAMGAAIGEGGTRIGIDDPQSYEEALNREPREKVIAFYTGSLSMRQFGLRTRKYLIMQRLATEDLTGYLMRMTKEGLENWVFLVLPIVFEEGREWSKTYRGKNERGEWRVSNNPPEGWTEVQPFGGDWRTEPGQPIWPELYGGAERAKEELEKVRKRTPDAVWAAQGLQRPDPPGGSTFRNRSWFPVYDELPGMAGARPQDMPIIFSTWDFAVKDKESNDPSAGWILAYYPSLLRYYVLDRVWGRWEFVGQEAQAMHVAEKLLREGAVHVMEGGGNGSALVSSCNMRMEELLRRRKISRGEDDPRNRCYEWMPRGMSKRGRGELVSPRFREHRVWFPRWAVGPPGHIWTPGDHRWYEHMLAEFLEFPHGAHDDMVDALDQGIIWMETVGLDLLLGDVGEFHLGRPGPEDAAQPKGLAFARDPALMWTPLRPW